MFALGVVLMWLGLVGFSPSVHAQGRTLLRVNMVRGFVTVYVNGQQVGRYGKQGITERSANALVTRDVGALVKPGANILRAVWSEKLPPTGEVHISFAAQSGPGAAFRELTRIEFGAMSKRSGDTSARFNLPDAQGRLSNAAGTAGSVGRRVQGSSRDNQTLLVANVTRGNIMVWLNGHKIGNYPSGLVRIDVSNYARGGANNLKLSWQGRTPIGKISVAYAAQRNTFRTIAAYDLGVFTKKTDTGMMQITFNLPSTASH